MTDSMPTLKAPFTSTLAEIDPDDIKNSQILVLFLLMGVKSERREHRR